MTALRIMTYNIQVGRGFDQQMDLTRAAHLINDCKPDLVAIQEVDRNAPRTDSIDQPATLASLTNMHSFFAPATNQYGGDYGNLILSRFPIQSQSAYQLNHLSDRESRNLISITINPTPNQTIRFLATHLDYIPNDHTDRIAQVNHIIDIYELQPDLPTIFAGDFNAQPKSRPLELLQPYFNNPSLDQDTTPPTLTWPAADPTMRLDYIFTSKAHPWQCTNLQIVPDAIASDHYPVIADLQLPS